MDDSIFGRLKCREEVVVRLAVMLLVFALLVVAFAGCVQARVGSAEYSDPYGFTPENPDKRWWSQERPVKEVNIDKFLYRWKGLTK
jgi:hypothetical protein